MNCINSLWQKHGIHRTSALLSCKSPLLQTFCKLFLTQASGLHGWEKTRVFLVLGQFQPWSSLLYRFWNSFLQQVAYPFRRTYRPNVYLYQHKKKAATKIIFQVRSEYAEWSASQSNHNCGKHSCSWIRINSQASDENDRFKTLIRLR